MRQDAMNGVTNTTAASAHDLHVRKGVAWYAYVVMKTDYPNPLREFFVFLCCLESLRPFAWMYLVDA